MTLFPISVTRARHALIALALVGGTMVAVAAPQSASAAPTAKLVVVDVNDATTSDFSSASLKTVNGDGSKSFAKPVDLPAADDTGVNAFALGGSSTGNGALARSADGNSLVIGGYHHAPGGSGQVCIATGGGCNAIGDVLKPKDTYAAANTKVSGDLIQRMVARIGNTGSVDSSTLLGTSLNQAHPRGVATDNGSSFYVSGNGGSTDTGVFTVPLGGGARVAIGGAVTGGPTGDQRNTRNIQIADGGLYAVSEKNPLAGLGKVGTGLPTTKSALTRLGAVVSTADLPVPTSVVMLDAGASVPGIDTAYVSFDTNDNDINDEIRKYTSDGTTWSANGTKTGDYPFLTGEVVDGTVALFATKGGGTANEVVRFEDTGGAGAANFGSDTTISTAAAGHAFRGVALAPTSWDPGTISSDAPTASVAHAKVGNTLGDANNPGTTLTLEDADTDAADLTVEADSSNDAVIPDSGITVSGSGADRAVTFEPAAVGRSTITFTVTDDNNNTGTAQVSYAASAAPASASGRYLYESSDLSSAVDVGDGYAIAVSSEDNKIRLYKQGESNRPAKEFDFEGDIGETNADLESMARAGDTLYVMGSHGNSSSDGGLKPARDVMFTATIAGSGASTELTYVAKRTGLRDDLKAWDAAHNNALGFAAGQADGKKANDPDGFNIEGFELAPGSTTTGYLGFRAPIKDGKAVLVPMTNLDSVLTGEPTFGDPILLDLGGRTIREIRKNSNDEYLISAQAGSASPEWKLFAWDGNRGHQAVGVEDLPAPDQNRTGAWESIVSVPSPLTAGGSTTLVTDSGDTTFYGDATVGASESKGLRKSYIDEFTTSSFSGYPDVIPTDRPSDVHWTTRTASGLTIAWNKIPSAVKYKVKYYPTGNSAAAKTLSVANVGTASITGLTRGASYTVRVAGVSSSGTQSPYSAVRNLVTSNLLPPTNFARYSTGSTSLKVSWTPAAGAEGYRIFYGIGSGPRTKVEVLGGSKTIKQISGLTPNTTYTIDIASIELDGTSRSDYTPRITIKTKAS